MIKRAGAIDTMIVSDTHVQVIVGPTVEILNEEISTNRGADLTFKDQLKQKEEVLNITTKSVNVKSVVGGKVEGLETLKDGVFSNGILGKGVVVRLDKKVNKQTIASPMAGIVTVAFPTKHAYGITTEDGVEVLVHIGLDTVELKGKGFKQLVKVGQEIKAGTPLAEIDLKTITDAGKIADPIVVVTSGQPLTKVASGKIKKGDALFTIK